MRIFPKINKVKDTTNTLIAAIACHFLIIRTQIVALRVEKAEGDLSGGQGFCFGVVGFLGLLFATLFTIGALIKHLKATQEERAEFKRLTVINKYSLVFLSLLLIAEILYFFVGIGR